MSGVRVAKINTSQHSVKIYLGEVVGETPQRVTY